MDLRLFLGSIILLHAINVFACSEEIPMEYKKLPELITGLQYSNLYEYLESVNGKQNYETDDKELISIALEHGEQVENPHLIKLSIRFNSSQKPVQIKLYSVGDILYTHDRVTEDTKYNWYQYEEIKLNIYRYIGGYSLKSDYIDNISFRIKGFESYTNVYAVSEYSNGQILVTKMEKPIRYVTCAAKVYFSEDKK